MGEHAIKLISIHSIYTKNISSKFHWNLMNQNRNMLENVHFGPDQPNCPAHFCPFCPKTAQRDLFLKNLFWPLFTPYCPLTSCKKSEKINDSISFKVQKNSFWVHFGPFWALLGQKRPKGFFSEKSFLTTFYPLLSFNFVQKIRKN